MVVGKQTAAWQREHLPGTSRPRGGHCGSCRGGPAAPATTTTPANRNESEIRRRETERGGKARQWHLDVVGLLDVGLGGRRADPEHVVVPGLPHHRVNQSINQSIKPPPLRRRISRAASGRLPRSPPRSVVGEAGAWAEEWEAGAGVAAEGDPRPTIKPVEWKGTNNSFYFLFRRSAWNSGGMSHVDMAEKPARYGTPPVPMGI